MLPPRWQSLALNSFSLPLHPLHSSVKAQKHHIISALAAFPYRPKVRVSHLLSEPGRSSYGLSLWFFIAIPLLKATLSFFPSHWGFGQVQISIQPAQWDRGRKVLILTPQRPSGMAKSDGPCPVAPWRKPVHVGSQSNTAEMASQPSGDAAKGTKGAPGFRGGTRGKLLEVGRGAMSMQLGQAGASRAC